MQDKCYTIRLQWERDHYDVYVVELGEGIHATGNNRQEALQNLNKSIYVYEKKQKEEKERSYNLSSSNT